MRATGGLQALLTVAVVSVLATGAAGEPRFGYETVVGGYYLASGRVITVDQHGNAYVAARTVGDHNQSNFLVVKLDAEGDEVWQRYIDGDGHDYAEGLVLDGHGSLLVAGWTDSEDFPTTPDAMDDTLTGFRDAFLLKLSAEDGSILYGTFLGGDYTDEAHGIALNDADEVYLVGSTGSTDFPTVNAYQNEPSAPLYVYTDVFITKLNPAGDTILYSTYFGGFKDDVGEDVAIDSDGSIVFAGKTNADDFPLANPIDASANNLFVSKLSADGSTLEFSTYIGGEDYDTLAEMTLGPGDFVYLAGSTQSADFPSTPGAFEDEFVGEINGCQTYFPVTYYNCDDAYVAKLATDGTGLVYGSFLGGSTIDVARGIAVDSNGSAIVVGYTFSDDFPGTDVDPAAVFLSKLSPSGSELAYTMVKTSGSANAGGAVAVDAVGDAYFTGAINVPADVYVAKVSGGTLSDIEDLVSGYRLHQNSPNPFNPTTSIAFELPAPSPVTMRVFNASGRVVRTLLDRELYDPGLHYIRWDGRDDHGREAPSGVYFYRIEAGGKALSERMVLVK